jgi:hypothetical protein
MNIRIAATRSASLLCRPCAKLPNTLILRQLYSHPGVRQTFFTVIYNT